MSALPFRKPLALLIARLAALPLPLSALAAKTVNVAAPTALHPTALDVIHVIPSGEHVFQLPNLSGLGATSLFLRPAADGSRLDLQSPAGLRFDLNLLAPLGKGQGKASFAGLVTQAAGGVHLAFDDWERPDKSALLLQHLNATGAVQQTVHVPRAH